MSKQEAIAAPGGQSSAAPPPPQTPAPPLPPLTCCHTRRTARPIRQMAAQRPPRGTPRGAPGLLLSKAAVGALLVAAVLHNCRSPHYLDSAAGDAQRDQYVGHMHLSLCLQLAVLQTLASAAWYLAAPGSPARVPWAAVDAVDAAACLAGAALRQWCFATLGRLFTYEVGIRPQHELVGSGPYALLLHPSYVGSCLLTAGIAAYLGGPWRVVRRWYGAAAMAAGLAAALGE